MKRTIDWPRIIALAIVIAIPVVIGLAMLSQTFALAVAVVGAGFVIGFLATLAFWYLQYLYRELYEFLTRKFEARR